MIISSAGTSLMVQWLRLHASAAMGTGSILVRKLRLCQAAQSKQSKKQISNAMITQNLAFSDTVTSSLKLSLRTGPPMPKSSQPERGCLPLSRMLSHPKG